MQGSSIPVHTAAGYLDIVRFIKIGVAGRFEDTGGVVLKPYCTVCRREAEKYTCRGICDVELVEADAQLFDSDG